MLGGFTGRRDEMAQLHRILFAGKLLNATDDIDAEGRQCLNGFGHVRGGESACDDCRKPGGCEYRTDVRGAPVEAGSCSAKPGAAVRVVDEQGVATSILKFLNEFAAGGPGCVENFDDAR